MVSFFSQRRAGPIGVDLGSRSVKLVQFDADHRRLVEAVRWDLSADSGGQGDRIDYLADALRRAREGRNFSGRDAVICLGEPDLFVQNIRVAKVPPEELQRLVFQEAAGRLPFPVNEAEVRFIEAADVRQGESLRREIIVLAVHQPVLEQHLQVMVRAGLRPVAVDTEPTALIRCYAQQYRRDEDKTQRAMFVHVGASRTAAVIAEGSRVLFIKYIDVGGRQMDEAVAANLAMDLADAAALRRHNGDRRAEQKDPEVARSIAESIRPTIDQLAGELSMCIRYHSVTFRGRPLARVVVGGGEASSALAENLSQQIDLKCEPGDPLRAFQQTLPIGRKGQWDVATGLALRKDH